MDAKVKYRALAVNAPNLPLKKVRVDVTLDKGVLTMDPIAFTFSRGDLAGRSAGRQSQGAAHRAGSAPEQRQARGLHHGQSGGKPAIEGPVMARAKLTGYGNSAPRRLERQWPGDPGVAARARSVRPSPNCWASISPRG
jgi:uncharacterized protein involved in outer membrane biogenesis